MNRVAILATLLLASCAHAPPLRIVTKEVKVPVSVPCKTVEPEQPLYAADAVDLGGDIFVLARALLVDREQRKAEATELRAAVKACQP